VIFSKRLSSIRAHVFFLALTIICVLLVEPPIKAATPVYFPLLTAILVNTVNGTAGWQFVQRRGEARLVSLYFGAQTGLLVFMMARETGLMSYSPATTVLAIPLMVQASVLTRRWRWLLFALIVAVILVTSALSKPDELEMATFLMPILVTVGLTFYLILYFSGLLVREEWTLQTNVKLDEDNRKLAEYAAQAEELATLRERNRLAREIHDNLGHYLTAVNIQIEAAIAVLETDTGRAQAALDKAQSLTKEGLSEIRRSIHALRANPIEGRALHEAIQMLVEEHRATGHVVNYEVTGAVRPCPAAVEMTLYRIAQEGLTNIRKHAHATQADLRLNYSDPTHICLELSDNGVGQSGTESGFGLLGIRERVGLLNGTLQVQTAAGQGFRLQVELPA
jgi:signal transduction histidine kinase